MPTDADTSGYLIRIGTVEDAAAAGRLHAGQITTGFLSHLGPRFLQRLYRRVVQWDGGLLLVAVEDGSGGHSGSGRVVGFVASADPTGGLYRQFLLHDGVMAVVTSFGPLVRNWRKVAETLHHGSSDGSGVGRGPEVLAIAVDRGRQGHGLGGRLLRAFIDAVVADGKSEGYSIIAQDNEASLAAYRSCGFRAAEVFELHAGTPSVVMQWDADAHPDAASGPDVVPS